MAEVVQRAAGGGIAADEAIWNGLRKVGVKAKAE
ncbi:hypothetical protein SAMN05421730_10593 [Anaerobium acetethylicum]|uniref:Uncharacterized protein n=1 Tax=Anaerobium acetethylicum TaxID=1619234 RepID=A0A1D3TZ33_9FIRM|nr:hypothetical protein SAMN05421730_10593 [Anaerobium acetethylicum]